ncbi:ribosomal protein S5 domain 2-type fold domain-containing protein [Pochonia chlamydosporia 170]|uniref:Ribosomal protein S5 domain 2-type fold domain-containing protein n=1 Tax=Pochonia chlamydosporia 170 TaxID=1380566 RepID=A0A179G5I9_METCM|nr:ribosomal protein S5 domain 2-type fold domain-containing protein [Pochonia chlamydosporia 170]OAQ72748.2 ribosomal protein S5 domain 2-type fold domain-containing protein [Pochonia chlamydosporia 170]
MAASSEPLAQLSQLPKADGSASFSYHGYAVTAAVNGPIEAPRRDENPFEALVDVIVRPAAGVGGTAERQLESILQAAIRQLIPIRNFPRCMIQVTLQVMETPENAYRNTKLLQPQLNLAIIPALFHAAILGLLTAAVPLKTIATATTIAISADSNSLIVEPSTESAAKAKSLHALAFTSRDELLLVESSGSFSVEDWNKILETGQNVCCREQGSKLDTVMSGDGLESQSVRSFIRSVTETKAAADLHWK